MSLRQDFGRRVRDVRKRQGLRQEDIAEEMGLSPDTFGRLERGETGEWLDNLEDLARALDTSPADLFAYASWEHGQTSEHTQLRVLLKDRAADLTEEDIRSLLDQIEATLKRRSRG